MIALYSSYGAELRAAHPAYFPHILILLVSAPHYGGTLLRVYEAAEDRERYRSFALGLTAAVVAAMLVATHSVAFASVLATVYLTWSPWHYTAQNYGLASMFLGRRGVTAPPGVKKLLRASFILSYALIFVVMHGATGGGYRDPFGIHGSSVAFLPLGIPEALAQLVLPVLVVAYLGVATAALIGMRRHAPRLASLGPTLMLMALQGVWFSIPMLVRFYPWNTGLEPFDLQARVIDYALFLAFGHSAQYLWVTSYFARKSGSWWRPRGWRSGRCPRC